MKTNNGDYKTTDHGTTDHGSEIGKQKSESRNQRQDHGTTDGGGTSNANDGDRSLKAAQRVAKKEWMRRAVARVAAEAWWRDTPWSKRVLAMTIARMMAGLTERKRIEIRVEEGAVRARFIYLLQRPERGCLSAVMLPECDRGAAN